MSKKTLKLNDLVKVDPFKTPEGYFEGLTNDIMRQLPDRVVESPKTINLWQQMQPWVYMAAMFAGIALMVKIFVGTPQQSMIKTLASEGIEVNSPSEIEEFYDYYDNRLAKLVYDDTFYSAGYSEISY
ncbi:hypothetical protein FACS189415_3000 [Bacteroidia bacterium]|nr:hypothetical protein FACS189426_16630 [Bacteroidia bacterium]GHU82484.1 hypothetical protein FACS189415_3000 [Bacteroidia bacterium]